MEEIRFIHTADLHLDSPFRGLNHMPKQLLEHVRESTFHAFEHIVNRAIERDVDFIVIVGDLFDGEDRSIKAQARLKRQMEKLEQADIAAFISHGNHDHLGGNWLSFDMPKNVYIFNKDVEMIPYITRKGVKVHLYGFSYPTRHVNEKKIIQYEKVEEADLHIGLLHGHCEGGDAHHQPYAPFSIKELLEKRLDYWALGHIHRKQILHKDPYIVYPGNIQGRHRKEQGDKGCYEVTLGVNGTTQLEFIPTAPIRWESMDLISINQMTVTDIYHYCIQKMEFLVDEYRQAIILEVNMDLANVHAELQRKIQNGELLELLQDVTEFGNNFVWVNKLNGISKSIDSTATSPLGTGFQEMLDFTIKEMEQEMTFEETISSLYSHPYGSRFLKQISQEEKKEILQLAKKLIVQNIGVKK